MKTIHQDLIVDFSHIDPKSLTEDWIWLIGEDMSPIMVSSIGDMFLKDSKGKIHWLNVGAGELKEVASDIEDLKEKMKDDDIANEWFMFALVSDLKKSGLKPKRGKLYGYKILPVLGGEYEVENFELTDIEVHFSLSGQVHHQVKDLPNGTKINFVAFNEQRPQ